MVFSILSLCILLIYVFWYSIKYGIPETLSDTYYTVGYWFTGVIWIIAALLVPQAIELTGETKIIPFAAIFGLLLVGCAPEFKGWERETHIGGACLAGIGSQLFLIIYTTPYPLILWIFPIIFRKSKKIVFWIELLCFFSIYYAEIIYPIL